MNSQSPADGQPRGELEAVLARELGVEKPALRHTALKLQPVVLPPPPTETAPTSTEAGATAEDDIALDEERGGQGRGRLIGLALLVLAVLGGGIGWFVSSREDRTPQAAIPTIQAPQPADLKAPAPPTEAMAPTTLATTTPDPPADKSMATIPTELTPPSTEGLSPARRVSSIRILVENDQEIRR